MISFEHRVSGTLFGCAVGDALGLGAEFMTCEQMREWYPHGLTDYDQIIRDAHRKRFSKGAWTDDMDMMLCIAETMIETRSLNPRAVAERFKAWFNDRPMGIGRTTYSVLKFKDYVDTPQKAAEIIWKLSRWRSAGNGGIMRTAAVGLWHERIAHHAEEICRLTHYDPRCTGSSVIISEMVHSLAYHGEALSFERMVEIGKRYDSRIEEYLRQAKEADSLMDLELDDKSRGYTLKTMAAALWILFHVESFEEGLITIVNAGGDADTNAAVACSLLGAKYGVETIPERYISGLSQGKKLFEIAERLRAVLP